MLNKCLVMRFLDNPAGPGHASEKQSGRSTVIWFVLESGERLEAERLLVLAFSK